MRMCQGRFKIVADLLVEVVVLLWGDVFLGARPNGAGFVDRFPFAGLDHATGLTATGLIRSVEKLSVFPFFLFHLNGQADVVGVLIDDALDLPGLGIVLCVVAQVQDDARSACFARDAFHLKRATATGAAVANPAHGLVGRQACTTRFNRNLVGHDKARVKAHAKLADQLGVSLLVAAELAHKVFGAALGDGAQVVDGFLLRQANAVVGDGQGFGVLIEGDLDLEFRVTLIQTTIVDGFKAQLVAGIRRVGDQLAQENFLVGVQRVGYQVQQLGYFGLEIHSLFGHGRSVS